MMKKLLSLVLALALLPAAAWAEFDLDGLFAREEVTESVDAAWNTVYSLSNPFYLGEIEDGTLMVTLDYIRDSQTDMILIRVDVLAMLYDLMRADTLTFTVGGKQYAFGVTADVFEYDGVYQEEYVICLSDTSLPFLKAIAQQKKDDPIPVTFLRAGEPVLEGVVVIPGDDAASIYDLFIDLGGKKQDLQSVGERWPCGISKAK